MAAKTILAYLPSIESVKPTLEAALEIAGPNGGHVIGMHVIATVPIYSEYPVFITAEMIEEMNRPKREAAEAIKAVFEERMKTSLVSREWACATGDISQVADIIIAQARVCDLTICPKLGADEVYFAPDVLERVVMESGRPVLILPKYAAIYSGDRVVVAWNDTREATRAVSDALEMLKTASAVRVVRLINEEAERVSAELATQQLVAALLRHGVNAAADVSLIGPGSAADSLITRMLDMNCDLLVMGCYGHSRLRETIFGGVSRKALDEFWTPLLMSR